MAEHLTSDERSKATSFHVVNDPFHQGLSFGTDIRGIYGATMPEILHLYLQGVITMIPEIVIHDLSTKGERALDSACTHLYHTARVQSSREFPKIGAFRNGMSTVRKLKAEERLSRVFILYKALMCSSFVSYLVHNGKQGIHTHERHTVDGLQSLIYVLETALSFHDFIKADVHDSRDFHSDVDNDESRVLQRTRRFMQELLNVLPTEKGMAWMITKFHQQLHIIANMIRHGSACNYDGGRPEYFGKYFAKNNVTRTQMRQISLAWQTSLRFFEHHCVLEVERLLVKLGRFTIKDMSTYSYLFESKEAEMAFEREHMSAPLEVPVPMNNIHLPQGSRFTFGSDDALPFDRLARTLKWDKDAPLIGYDPGLLRYLANRLWLHDSGGIISQESVVNGFTELRYGDDLFRAHPCYRKGNHWNDWAMIRWEGQRELLPARILMFVSLKNCEILANRNEPFLEQKDYAVIQSVVEEDYVYSRDNVGRYVLKSRLAKRHSLERTFRLVGTESIASPAYVFANDMSKIDGHLPPYDNTVVCLRDRNPCWKESFVRL